MLVHASSDGVTRRRAAPPLERPTREPRAAEGCQRERAGVEGGSVQSTRTRPAFVELGCLLQQFCSNCTRSHTMDALEGAERCCRVPLDKVDKRCASCPAPRVP